MNDDTILQPAVRDLLQIAPQLRSNLSDEQIDAAATAIDRLERPVSVGDALALLSLLPSDGDDCFEIRS